MKLPENFDTMVVKNLRFMPSIADCKEANNRHPEGVKIKVIESKFMTEGIVAFMWRGDLVGVVDLRPETRQ